MSLAAHTFTSVANAHLAELSRQRASALQRADDASVVSVSHRAAVVRRATLVYAAAADILPALPPDRFPHLAPYLSGLVARLSDALQAHDTAALETLADAATTVLDSLETGDAAAFAAVQIGTLAVSPRPAESFAVVSEERGEEGGVRAPEKGFLHAREEKEEKEGREVGWEGEGDGPRHAVSRLGRKRGPVVISGKGESAGEGSGKGGRWTFCGLSFAGLTPRDKLILWLYLLMVLGALIAVTAVTVDFAKQQINPGSFIQSEQTDSLPAPVVTVCLSQRGVPFSRLQLFNFTNAEGVNVVGADPMGEQTDRQSEEFRRSVDRFWDNPDGEDCNTKVGDFFPFPLKSLNDIASGKSQSKCRPCYRVGRKELAVARSTEFRDSSVLEFYTDNYFLQCMKSEKGLDPESLDFMHDQLVKKKGKMEELDVLSSDVEELPVSNMTKEQFEKADTKQICNMFYFAFFPKALGKGTGGVDVRYAWNGTDWIERGDGPYFNLPKAKEFLPQESLQMFVGTNSSTKENRIGRNRDMILIGPNTQTFATFRPVVVYGQDRYDIASSTSNLWRDDVFPLFGYWLVYRIYYNYNRFVTDEWYRESTYPASQWIVDLTGYASLFTGASLFSLLLLPLLQAMRKREKQRLLKQRPEVYLWSKHKQRYPGETGNMSSGVPNANIDIGNSSSLRRGTSVMLPGYNV